MRKVIRFPRQGGLYVRDDGEEGSPPVDCCVAATEIEGWTQREIERAKAARKFYHDLNAESLQNMKTFIRSNIVRNVPVTTEDLTLAEEIFEKDVATCKGKWTKHKPPTVTREDVIELPLELRTEGMEVDLAINVVFVNDEVFLHTLDRRFKTPSLVVLGTKKKG